MAELQETDQHQQTVRFSSENQEIESDVPLHHVEVLTGTARKPVEELTPEAQEELRNLALTLEKSRLQSRRMENFAYEPVSLPVSRVPSTSSNSRTSSRHQVDFGPPSPKPSTPPTFHSPPLTPADSSREDRPGANSVSTPTKNLSDPAMITPQVSSPNEAPSRLTEIKNDAEEMAPPSQLNLEPPRSPQFPESQPGQSGDVPEHVQDSSASTTVAVPGSSTPYSRPFAPVGDRDDPYARNKRPPQTRNLESIDARFVFSGRDARKRHSNPNASSQALRSSGSSPDLRPSDEKRHSSFFGGKKRDDHDSSANGAKGHGSMSDLKRFFKLSGHKHKEKRRNSPVILPRNGSSSGATPSVSSHTGSSEVPFADDHGLQSKYGKFGKVLGSGAGGSVRLMKRTSDGVTFAVKQFRPRHNYESEREYNKKVTAEFCIGSTLHHGNVIETMDIIHEKGNWYEVMEYAPFDLFAIVMTGKMSREEVNCCTLQILSGVTYLHSMGLAHRDLKLDNVVVNEHGIMKIIDFGSAVVFRYPFENEIVLASGIVGSDPYLAPEVYELAKYDPQAADIWSLAIIFCCMTLRRFPWKAPRLSDTSYKLFVSAPMEVQLHRRGPDIGSKSASDLQHHAHHEDHRRSSAPQSEPATRQSSDTAPPGTHHHHHHNHHHNSEKSSAGPSSEQDSKTGEENSRTTTSSTTDASQIQPQTQVIKGPWRLLRLLPRETRHIMSRMLEVDPKKRATLEEILEDPWVLNSPVCVQSEKGHVVRPGGHEHTLEPSSGSTPASSRKDT